MKPKILIEVTGGVARFETFPEDSVDILLVDYDDFEAGEDPPDNWREFVEFFPSLNLE